MKSWSILILIALASAGVLLAFAGDALAVTPAAPPAEGAVRFNRDIRPILSDNCFFCHGPDSAHRKAGMRFDREDGLFAKRDKGTPVVPGKPAESLVWQHVISNDPDEVMPPADSHKKLTAQQKDLLRRWIEQGAKWEPHWSLLAPTRPALPEAKNAAWARNAIDQFVLARLEQEGLQPAPEADRHTLLRRVTFDLTGLPPTPKEIDDFLNDKSPDAYERVVDRLLASPRYGEHRAHYWLDAARYGDTHGLHFDNYREMWAYRDWVIDAFNRDMPFDRFTIEQIAGDLLPNRTLEQQIASGFQRCNITTNEGGSIPDEVAASYAKDRADTTGTVFLGLTVGCATCHDHKFDPVTQKEFYQLTAFYRNTTQKPLDGNVQNTSPVAVVPAGADRTQWDTIQKQLRELQTKRDALRTEAAKAYDAWAKSAEPSALREPLDPKDQDIFIPLDEGKGTEAAYFTGASGDAHAATIAKELTWADGPNKANKQKALKFAKGADLKIGDGGAGDLDADHPFSLGAWVLVPPEEGNFTVASKLAPPQAPATKPAAAKGKQEKAKPTATPGWSLEVNSRLPTFRLIGSTAGEELKIAGNNSLGLKGGTWHHFFITYDGSRSVEGLDLYVDGKPQYGQPASETNLKSSSRNSAPMRIGSDSGANKRDLHGGAVREFRIYKRELVPEEVAVLSKWDDLHHALSAGIAKLTRDQQETLRELYLNRFDPPYHDLMARLADVDDAQRPIRRRSAVSLVMEERTDSKPTAHVLYRGQYDQARDEVQPGTPAALHAFRDEWPRNRLGLAYWIVDPRNPLTARVTINRLWQEVFGQGLVRTSEDFGIMGANPSHPELLDWMAVEFQSNWDVKKALRLIVTSSTYRQSAAATPVKLERDAGNVLLSRGPRFRMDAETLRDMALASSGLLVEKIGGPSVKPYQPPGVWESVAMQSSNTRVYKQDHGESLYRRSLYTFWKRAAPPASLDVFNAPSRESCTVRRERTDTPLQALVTMNDPQWVEAARHLAEQALRDVPTGADPSAAFNARLDFITLRILARSMEAKERDICRATLDDLLAHYREKPDDAKKLIAAGESKADEHLAAPELAAWTMLASQVMNTDEALNK